MEHKNFYENIKEANMRLQRTIVLYDGEPYYILVITDHKKDGIFRVYMVPAGDKQIIGHLPSFFSDYPAEYPSMGELADKWLEANKEKVLRKHMNSPLFNKFLPYPLGMCNSGNRCYYVERQPNRKSEQGLIRSMLYEDRVTVGQDKGGPIGRYGNVDIFSPEFQDTIMGRYPTPETCLKGMKNPEYTNEAVGFSRKFALAKGPIDTLFLAYKGDVVGILPRNDFSQVKLGKNFTHTKEVISELQLFGDVVC